MTSSNITCVPFDHALVTNPTRLAELDDLSVLDTPWEQGFDDVVQIARLICQAPVSLVSLVASDRQWFKAKAGFDSSQTDLNSSVCAHALSEPDMLVIGDLTQDGRTRQNPLVTGEPHIRFYAGAPLRMPGGQVIGSLCVIDTVPRPTGLSAEQADGLKRLARQTIALLQARRQVVRLTEHEAEISLAFERQRTLIDLSDRLRDFDQPEDMTKAAAELVGRGINVTRAGYADLDETGEYVHMLGSWTPDGWETTVRRRRFADFSADFAPAIRRGETLVVDDVDADPRTAAAAAGFHKLKIASLINVPLMELGRPVGLFYIHDAVARTWRLEEVTFARNIADRVQSNIARIRAQERQQLLNNELSHRMKNVLAMVQAIAMQTMRNAVDLETARDALNARLVTMGNAHDILLAGRTEAASLDAVVRSALTLTDESRFRIEGPPIVVGSKAALSLSMMFHELMTNAAKYGALQSPQGRVTVAWRIDDGDSEPRLNLQWIEEGGPSIQPPARRGFGSRLIERALIGVVGGKVTMAYPPSGVVCEVAALVSGLQAES